MNAADLSIIIPVYNRDEVIRYAFESLRRATGDLAVGTAVDDGSLVAVADIRNRLDLTATKIIRPDEPSCSSPGSPG